MLKIAAAFKRCAKMDAHRVGVASEIRTNRKTVQPPFKPPGLSVVTVGRERGKTHNFRKQVGFVNGTSRRIEARFIGRFALHTPQRIATEYCPRCTQGSGRSLQKPLPGNRLAVPFYQRRFCTKKKRATGSLRHSRWHSCGYESHTYREAESESYFRNSENCNWHEDSTL